jgi:hypothetical protein
MHGLQPALTIGFGKFLFNPSEAKLVLLQHRGINCGGLHFLQDGAHFDLEGDTHFGMMRSERSDWRKSSRRPTNPLWFGQAQEPQILRMRSVALKKVRPDQDCCFTAHSINIATDFLSHCLRVIVRPLVEWITLCNQASDPLADIVIACATIVRYQSNAL